jgi:hypothetical protein
LLKRTKDEVALVILSLVAITNRLHINMYRIQGGQPHAKKAPRRLR